MGLGAIDYALHGPRRPRLLVVTDIDQHRLDRAASIFTTAAAREAGVELHYANTGTANPIETIKALNGGEGYDDVFVFAPVAALVEQAGMIAGFNGCINFFAGPSKPDFTAPINFYDVHYSGLHVVGSSGGNTRDMREALQLMSEGKLTPAVMVTHVGGIDAAAQTILDLPGIPGGKKLIYTNISMPLVALADLREKADRNPMFGELARIIEESNGLWSAQAENYLLSHAPRIDTGN